ncbi:MAG: S9 family peptidase, partial [Burkholderiales bacterium]|nr:S9 family peptidase [Burkholderiales bacterium]
AKSSVAWVDADTLAVATDFGAGSMTLSGYPRRLKLWKRGTELATAAAIYEIAETDVGLWLWDEQGRQLVVEHRQGFFDGKQLLLRPGKVRKLQALQKPDDASALPQGERLLLELRKDWQVGGQTYAAGSLLAMGTQALIEGRPQIQTLFSPGERSALHSYAATRNAVIGVVQTEQGQTLREWRWHQGRWQSRDLPAQGAVSLAVRAVDSLNSDRYWLTRSGFLQPSELRMAEAGHDRQVRVQQLPELFDASGLEVQRLHTTAADGTRIPYWLVQPKGPVPPGGRPTLLYGYGGFEIALNPSYSGILGRAWYAQGGAYVVANIRGGGEFGPRWHQSAQKEHRQRSFGDFIAVAEDLLRRGLTSPKQLGIMGGSLGGLLTSVAMVQRPELFGAVVSQVPLTDMRRYHRLLAGHSWIAEYGDPDVPAEWDYIQAYSPYQQAKGAPAYPPVLYTSSTLDDRVHPGHARKMVARLQELGQPVWYWENREGGHAGASDLRQTALMWALSYRFLQQQLMAQSKVAGERAGQ